MRSIRNPAPRTLTQLAHAFTKLTIAGGVVATSLALPPRPPIDPGNVPVIDFPDLDDLPPIYPTDLKITARRANSLRLQFRDNSNDETGFHIYRRIGETGPLQLIATLPAGVEAVREFTDTGLTADTAYMYQVGAFNSKGERSLQPFGAYTRSAVAEPVWRVQLAVRVADQDDANMDDNLQVLLNSASGDLRPSFNDTWLDYGRDDFERGSFFVYDLNLDGIDQRSDITQIQLRHEGSDAVCIDSIGLYVNEVSVYARDFAAEGRCKSLDDSDRFTVSHETLRSDPRWQSYITPPAPLFIDRNELESRIEGMMGHMLHDQDAYWGDRDGRAFVEATFVDAERLHVTLDLKGEVDNFFDPEIDISFDLVVSAGCESDGSVAITIATENFDASVDLGFLGSVIDFFTPIPPVFDLPCAGGVGRCLERRIASAIEAAFVPISLEIVVDTPICDSGFEPTVEVLSDASIALGFRARNDGVPFRFLPRLSELPLVDVGLVGGDVIPLLAPGNPIDPVDPETAPVDVVDADEPATVGDGPTPTTDGAGAADEAATNDATTNDDAANEAQRLTPAPFGCGGPVLLNGLMALMAAMPMRSRAQRARRA
ncbi:MAG: fibronectin type III domain-containing protein [Phycisphaerae bacterium]|nr:fibronectin type III domain-containing protein [Phycisphaerae bacterium]